jgi:hypothetical protein
LNLSSRVSILSEIAQGVPAQGEHASPRGSAAYGHTAAIELILARAASPNSRPALDGGPCARATPGSQISARARNVDPRFRRG